MLNNEAVGRVFHALSDPTRRALVEQLSRGPASVSELAVPLEITLAAVVQHLQVLEQSGLVATEKVGRVRSCRMRPEGLGVAEKWITERRSLWERRFDRLGELLEGKQAAPSKAKGKRIMKVPPVAHGSFTIERTYEAPVARVFAAFCDIETKARWFIGPPDAWKLKRRELDLRVGGSELLEGEFGGGRTSLFTARYHAIVPNERLVYAYDMHVSGKHLSVSLATVELHASRAGETRMMFTEQAAFLDGGDGTRSRQDGTATHFDRMATVLTDPNEIVSTRVLDAPRSRVYDAFADPAQLVRWWGPKGFTSTFDHFELRPGGAWRFTMRGPDGTEYPNAKDFTEVREPERIAYRHVQANHDFTMAMTFVELGDKTLLIWTMRFDSTDAANAVRAFIEPANEENFDRLVAHIGPMTAGS